MECVFIKGKLNLDKFFEIGSKYNLNLNVDAILDESIYNFNNMNIMKAMDNITAVLKVMDILYDNECLFNTKKIIIYGQSHGAYLSYLCNALAPTLFSLIIDNSAWIYPLYVYEDRLLTSNIENLYIVKRFKYLAKEVMKDKQILDLNWIYSQFKNNCNIISYHGTTDNLISNVEKRNFCNRINKCNYIEISEERVDNVVFKSTNHALDADFIKLFEYTMENVKIKFEKSNVLQLKNNVEFTTYKHKYTINYSDVLPNISIGNYINIGC